MPSAQFKIRNSDTARDILCDLAHRFGNDPGELVNELEQANQVRLRNKGVFCVGIYQRGEVSFRYWISPKVFRDRFPDSDDIKYITAQQLKKAVRGKL